MGNSILPFCWIVTGLTAFFALGQLVSFAAGNFNYIGATDLVSVVNKHSGLQNDLIHFAALASGFIVILMTRNMVA